MSPEQAAGRLERLGPASDVYSLGATLYCLLTGQPPLEEADVGEVLRRVQRGEFPPPRQVDRGVPGGAGGDLPEGDGLEARGPLRLAAGAGRRHRALAGRRAGRRPTASRSAVRLTRWGRRHRTVAAGIGALLVTAVVALASAPS